MKSELLLSKRPYQSLEEALKELIKCLDLFVPFRLWKVSRVHGNEVNILVVDDKLYKILPGTLSDWGDSYCSKMVEGQGPCFAPDAQAIPVYAAASVNATMQIGAYIGQPLLDHDGTLLGTLCGVDPNSKPALNPAQQTLVEMVTRTMSWMISRNLTLDKARQEEAKLRHLAERDALTGLVNRHVWNASLAEEERALNDLGENAMVLIIDLDGLKTVNDTKGHACGDQYIVDAARVLQAQLRDIDIIARLGGDEFGAIVRNASKDEAKKLYERLRTAFCDAEIQVSTGYAMRLSSGNLATAVADADARMYGQKALRKASEK